MDFDTQDLPSYIPGYDDWINEREQDDYDNDNIPVDDIIEEQFMIEREQLVQETDWICIEDTPSLKKYVSSTDPHFFRSVSSNGVESSWKEMV